MVFANTPLWASMMILFHTPYSYIHFISGTYGNFQDLSPVTVKLGYVNWFQRSDWHLIKMWLSTCCPTIRICETKFEQTPSNLHEEFDAVSLDVDPPSILRVTWQYLVTSSHTFVYLNIRQLMLGQSLHHVPICHVPLWIFNQLKTSVSNTASFPNRVPRFHEFLQLFSQVYNKTWCSLAASWRGEYFMCRTVLHNLHEL